MRARLLLPLLLPAIAPLTAAAQESDVVRERFTFLASNLTIEVRVEAPGTLRVMRGRNGLVEVAARARVGFAGFGLAADDPGVLNLTAVGAERVEFLVIVPSDARVVVRLPDRHASEVLGTLQSAATYTWKAPPGSNAPPRGP